MITKKEHLFTTTTKNRSETDSNDVEKIRKCAKLNAAHATYTYKT